MRFAREVEGRSENPGRFPLPSEDEVQRVTDAAAAQSVEHFSGLCDFDLPLALTGVPFASVLTVVRFVFCGAQIGPVLVVVPSIAWLYWSASPLWGTALLIWSVPVLVLDNFLRPILIRRTGQLPLLLVFAGVLGGLISVGVIGLFIGPVFLAVTYTPPSTGSPSRTRSPYRAVPDLRDDSRLARLVPSLLFRDVGHTLHGHGGFLRMRRPMQSRPEVVSEVQRVLHLHLEVNPCDARADKERP